MAMSRAVAAIKRARVVEAVADGATHEQAAEQVGYAGRSGSYEAYWKAMDGRVADAAATRTGSASGTSITSTPCNSPYGRRP